MPGNRLRLQAVNSLLGQSVRVPRGYRVGSMRTTRFAKWRSMSIKPSPIRQVAGPWIKGSAERVASGRKENRVKKAFITGALLALAACSDQHQEPQSSPPVTQTAPANSSPQRVDAIPPASTAEVPAGSYKLDREHASLIFRVNHLGFSNYTARFKRFDVQLEFDPRNLAASKVIATVDPGSLETDYPNPDKVDFNAVLKGVDWLNVAEFPEMRFESARIDVTGENTVRINGDLTLHGVTRPIVLEARFNGGYAGHPMDPQARIGFSAQGRLQRSQFGIAYGIPEPGTTMGVSDDVSIVIEAEFKGPPLVEKPS